MFSKPINLSGYLFIIIGVFELIKYPNRAQRWADKKSKEKNFNKDIKFVLKDNLLEVLYNNMLINDVVY